MPGYYETRWDAAKADFEEKSGKIIAKVFEMQLKTSKKKVAGLKGEKTEAPRLKKPAASGWFGRKSSGMETACKALDKASNAKVSEKDKNKAFDDYEKAAKKYEKELRDSVKDESKPYMYVQLQIEILEEKMWAILEEYRIKILDIQEEDTFFGHLDQNNHLFEKEIKDLESALREINIETTALHIGGQRRLNHRAEPFNKVIAAVIKGKLLPALTGLEAHAKTMGLGKPSIDGLVEDLKKQLKKPFVEETEHYQVVDWITGISKAINKVVKPLRK